MTDCTPKPLGLRRPALVAVAALALVSMAACGSDAVGSRVTSAARPAPAPRGELVAVAGERSARATALTMRATVTRGDELVSTVTTTSDAAGSKVAVSAELPELGTVEARAVDGTWYLYVPALVAGARWVSIDPGSFGAVLPAAGDLLGGDPRAVFDALADVSSRVTEVGPDQVEGVPATRFRMTIDARRLPAGSGPDVPTVRGTADLDVWIDGDGYVRRIRSEVDDPAGASDVPYVFDATVLSYDGPVDVVPPPAEETLTFGQFLSDRGLRSLDDLLGGD